MVRKLLQSKWFTPVILILAGIVAIKAMEMGALWTNTRREVSDWRQRISQINSDTFTLEKNNELANSDSYLERQARQKLNFKKPDEKVAYVYKSQYNQGSAMVSPEITEPAATIWQKFLNWFKGE